MTDSTKRKRDDESTSTPPTENRTPYLIVGGAAAAYAAYVVLGIISSAVSLAFVVPAAYYGFQLYNSEEPHYKKARELFAKGSILQGLWESFPTSMNELYSKLGGPSTKVMSEGLSQASKATGVMFSNVSSTIAGAIFGGPKQK